MTTPNQDGRPTMATTADKQTDRGVGGSSGADIAARGTTASRPADAGSPLEPWFIQGRQASTDTFAVGPKGSGWVAQVRGEDSARLIAAAPELLAVLDEILTYDGDAGNALEDPYVMGRAAEVAAKAEGRDDAR